MPAKLFEGKIGNIRVKIDNAIYNKAKKVVKLQGYSTFSDFIRKKIKEELANV